MGIRMGDEKVIDLIVNDGLTCAFSGIHMGVYGRSCEEDGSLVKHKMNGHIVAINVRFRHIKKVVLKRRLYQ